MSQLGTPTITRTPGAHETEQASSSRGDNLLCLHGFQRSVQGPMESVKNDPLAARYRVRRNP